MNEPQLRRSLGLFDIALFFVVAGSNLQWVATAAAAGASSLVVWVIGGLTMFLPLSIVVVYLGTHHPDEGGMYVWAKRAFGPFSGFMTGWTYWMSNLPYFPALLAFAAGNALYVSSHGGALLSSNAYFITAALAGLALATVLNILGLDVGKWLNNIGATSRWAVTLLLITIGAVTWWKFGSATPVNAQTLHPGLQLKDVIFWSVIAFAWTGPEAMSFMSGEVKNPRRSIPFGLAIAAPAIAAIYIVGTWSVMTILPASSVNASSGVMQAIAAAAGRLGWGLVTPVAALLVAISCLGSCSAWLGAVARIPFVAGIDHFLPASFGRMHPRWGSPVAALVTQSAIAAVFIFLSNWGTSVKGAYDVLVGTTVLITMVPFLFLFASALKLYGEPTTAEMIRIPGGKITVLGCAALGFLTTLVSAILAAFPADDEPNKPLAVVKVLGVTALMVGSGALVYYFGQRNAARLRVLEAQGLAE